MEGGLENPCNPNCKPCPGARSKPPPPPPPPTSSSAAAGTRKLCEMKESGVWS